MEPRAAVAHEPAVVLICGAWHLPEAYVPLLDQLFKAGFLVRCPRLPTNGDVRPPKANLQDDVAAVRAVVSDLISTRHQIIILAHSWGGLVACEAITEHLYAKDGTAGVVRLIYLSAWLIQPDTCLAHLIEKYGYDSELDLDLNEDGMSLPKNAPEALYHDLGVGEVQELTKQLVRHNFMEISATVTHAPWKDLPTLFVHCTNDLAIGLGLQKHQVKDAIESGAAELTVRELESSHSPFRSMPAALVRIVEDVWRSYRGCVSGH